ncbi:MAG: DUF1579 family protein [Gammaproteobacteria bacterium]
MRHRSSLFGVTLAILLCGAVVFAQAPASLPKPGPEVKKLGVLVGNWTESVELKPSSMMPSGGKLTLSLSCVWIVNGFAVSCTETGEMPGMGKVTDKYTMAYDSEAKNYIFFEVSSDGEVGTTRGTINGDTWVFESDLPMQGKMTHDRFTAHYTSKDSADVIYEMGPDASHMQVIMEGKQTRVKPALAAPKKTS